MKERTHYEPPRCEKSYSFGLSEFFSLFRIMYLLSMLPKTEQQLTKQHCRMRTEDSSLHLFLHHIRRGKAGFTQKKALHSIDLLFTLYF